MLKTVKTNLLDIAYDEQGSSLGWPVILLHGFPYDIHAYADVAARLSLKGARAITPYLRGYGPTRFLSSATPGPANKLRWGRTCWLCSTH